MLCVETAGAAEHGARRIPIATATKTMAMVKPRDVMDRNACFTRMGGIAARHPRFAVRADRSARPAREPGRLKRRACAGGGSSAADGVGGGATSNLTFNDTTNTKHANAVTGTASA